jgi:transketolase
MSSSSQAEAIIRGTASTDVRANALRALAMDAVQQARSGHPGAPMGMAEMAVALWTRHLRHNPDNPGWIDRDRFVLSNGHASMLLYALLHLTGYNLPLDELRRFRQLGSRTPGHPEHGMTPGVETTTGPLGQGLANAVGMALAERQLAQSFNRPGHAVIDHRTYVFVGDGCLMEGISQEAISMAGTWGLDKLIVLYDDNGISIDGPVAGWFGDDTPARFRASGWRVLGPLDGHDIGAIDAALAQARNGDGRPTLIACRTTIGAGSPARAGTAKAHGEPLGDDEIRATRQALGWPHAPFELPDDVAAAWDARAAGRRLEADWTARLDAYRAEYPALAAELERRMRDPLPEDWPQLRAEALVRAMARTGDVATRKASQQVLADLAPRVPAMFGGSADLTGSNLTDFPDAGARHLSYGVREFGMAAAMNGIALHGGLIPYGGTFLTFSDYSRNAIRMAALMRLRIVHVFTHDSIGLGEDGPTHQAVEHAASLRLIPNLDVWRPCDGMETAVAWIAALERTEGPSALLLSRQALPAQARPRAFEQIARGGYVLAEDAGAEATLLATGSEVGLAMQACGRLAARGIAVRVVSLPSMTRFARQPREWRESVLGALPRIGVEAGVTAAWDAYACVDALGVDRFGESAPGPAVYAHFGLTADALAERVARVVRA